MPELPDLQIFSHNLDKKLSGKKLKKVTAVSTKKLKVTEKELKHRLEKHTLTKVYREGKELYFEFDNCAILALHLMLNGKLYFYEKENEQKYTILELLFDDDTGLALTDYQEMATPTLDPEPKVAPDALSKEVTAKWLELKLAKKRTVIKNFLLDQHEIRGIGNAYADEILWEAGISPFSVANKIPAEKIKVLAKAITSVLHDAEKSIRKTHPDIIAGEVRDFLKIHNAKKKESPTGAAIEHKMANSRKTYFTSEQELFT
ncbi:MAG: DNA-formamidopyrimidine glycosylase family protein [Bacteroidota bacterium]